MKFKRHKLVMAPALLALFSTLNLHFATARAQGTAFTYQGRLNNGGSPASGTYDLTFTLFDTNISGVAIAGPVTNSATVVSDGLFTTTIDFGSGVFTGGSNWLEIAARTNGNNAFTTLTPRQQLTPAPYAITAESLAGVVSYNTISGQYATVGGGYENSATNEYATVAGGYENISSGWASTVGGGAANTASSPDGSATVSGGYDNTASGDSSTVGGGEGNTTPNSYSTVGGGQLNSATGDYATIAGGAGNTSSNTDATIGGGMGNTAGGYGSTVAGGYQNSGSGEYSAVGGGYNNIASGLQTAIGSGQYNVASGPGAAVGSGEDNVASGGNTAIGGGYFNTASGNAATVPGGSGNVASGAASFAAGHTASAVHDGSFVWSDYSGAAFSSTAANQFSVSAAGGVVLAGDVAMVGGANAYHNFSLSGGNALGYLYGSFPALGDGIHLGYNYYYDNNGNGHVSNTGGETSLLTAGYGFVGIYVGAVNEAPTTQRLLANSSGVTVNGTFDNSSDRNLKQDFAPISPAQILEKVGQLPITEWSYKEDPKTRHVGPVAQDFHSVFNIGTDDKHIAQMDEGGVALAAIKGLSQKLEETRAENAELKTRLEKLEQLIKTARGKEK